MIRNSIRKMSIQVSTQISTQVATQPVLPDELLCRICQIMTDPNDWMSLMSAKKMIYQTVYGIYSDHLFSFGIWTERSKSGIECIPHSRFKLHKEQPRGRIITCSQIINLHAPFIFYGHAFGKYIPFISINTFRELSSIDSNRMRDNFFQRIDKQQLLSLEKNVDTDYQILMNPETKTLMKQLIELYHVTSRQNLIKSSFLPSQTFRRDAEYNPTEVIQNLKRAIHNIYSLEYLKPQIETYMDYLKAIKIIDSDLTLVQFVDAIKRPKETNPFNPIPTESEVINSKCRFGACCYCNQVHTDRVPVDYKLTKSFSKRNPLKKLPQKMS
jgi:hypothetical protein